MHLGFSGKRPCVMNLRDFYAVLSACLEKKKKWVSELFLGLAEGAAHQRKLTHTHKKIKVFRQTYCTVI